MGSRARFLNWVPFPTRASPRPNSAFSVAEEGRGQEEGHGAVEPAKKSGWQSFYLAAAGTKEFGDNPFSFPLSLDGHYSLPGWTDVLLQDQRDDSFAEPHHVWPGDKRIVLFTDTQFFYIKFKARNKFFLE